ncbi:MAG: hypothetical protein ABSC92_13435 [Rhizomicrobium sp.]|jgi:hypothetical protein
MRKVPVFRTIGRAYGFTFGNLATIIGLVWLPLLIQTAVGYAISVRYMGAIQALLARGDFSAFGGMVGQAYLFFFVGLFLTAVMSAPVMRQALGLRQGGATVYFWPGANEFRLFGANLALMLMIFVIAILVWIAVFVLALAFGFGMKALGPAMVGSIAVRQILVWVLMALLLAVLSAFFYILLRLSFLVAAVTIAERKIDLVRAWSLTRGNFWRIFVVLCAISVPLLVLSWAVEWALFGSFGSTPSYIAPSQPGENFVARAVAAQLQAMQSRMPVMIGIVLFLAPLRLGLDLGAASFAYRALVPPAAPDKAATETLPTEAPAADLRATDLAQAT